MRRSALSITVVVVGALTLLGCADDGRDMAPPRDDQSESIIAPTETSAVLDTATPAPTEPMTIYGPWLDGGPIPSAHTCAEAGTFPSISWTGIPAGTVSLAVVMLDTSDTSVDPVGRTHWVVTGIDPSVTGLESGVLPAGAVMANNAFGTSETPEMAWRAPCPPAATVHTYVFEIHALDQQIELPPETPAADMVRAIDFATIASASLSGTVMAI
jgi:Raf kinase inhibitor-like YbhB/YbcL family protein